jgi:hypothetical protein
MQTWIECLLRASHDERDVFLRRERMTLQPGQFVMGREEFGAAIGISGSTAWYWMLQFEADSMVDIKKTAKGSIVSVKNWGEYQNLTAELATNEQQKNTNKNDKNVKNEKKQSSDKPKTPTGDKTDHLMPLKIYILAFQKTFASVEHIQDLIRRCVRESKALTAYTPKMIALACLVADDERAASGKQYDITLETVGKKLAQHAAHLPESPQNLSWANELLAKYESMKDTMLSKTSSLISVPTA